MLCAPKQNIDHKPAAVGTYKSNIQNQLEVVFYAAWVAVSVCSGPKY
jgi:hypothetical protein